MAKFDFGAWSKHFKEKLEALQERQGELEQAVSSLSVLVRDLPRPEKEPPIVMVEDAFTVKARAYCYRLDAAVAGSDCRTADMTPEVRRMAWRRQCKRAIMSSDKKELNALLAWYYLWRELQKGNEEVRNGLASLL